MTAPRWTAEQAAEHQARILADAYREQHPAGPRTRARSDKGRKRGRVADDTRATTPDDAHETPIGETQTLWIPGNLPSLNQIIALAKRQRGSYSPYNDAKAQWHRNVAIYAERCELVPITRARFVFEWIAQDRRTDPDNIAAARKFILDGLVACGILPGDGWAHVVGFEDRFAVDANAPGVRVEIVPED